MRNELFHCGRRGSGKPIYCGEPTFDQCSVEESKEFFYGREVVKCFLDYGPEPVQEFVRDSLSSRSMLHVLFRKNVSWLYDVRCQVACWRSLEDWLGFYKRAHVIQSFAPTCILCHAESPEARQRLGQLFETASTRFGLRSRPSVLRDVMFHQVPCVARLHIPATSDALTVVDKNDVYLLPERLDELVAGSRHHLPLFLRISSLV